MIKIGQTIEVNVYRSETNFDKACDEANRSAIRELGIDEDGHSSRVENWERSSCWFRLTFLKYTREGTNHIYFFEALVINGEDDG